MFIFKPVARGVNTTLSKCFIFAGSSIVGSTGDYVSTIAGYNPSAGMQTMSETITNSSLNSGVAVSMVGKVFKYSPSTTETFDGNTKATSSATVQMDGYVGAYYPSLSKTLLASSGNWKRTDGTTVSSDGTSLNTNANHTDGASAVAFVSKVAVFNATNVGGTAARIQLYNGTTNSDAGVSPNDFGKYTQTFVLGSNAFTPGGIVAFGTGTDVISGQLSYWDGSTQGVWAISAGTYGRSSAVLDGVAYMFGGAQSLSGGSLAITSIYAFNGSTISGAGASLPTASYKNNTYGGFA
jgi:hypothetical protein